MTKATTTKAAPKEKPSPTLAEVNLGKAPVAVRDASNRAFDLARGLDSLFYGVSCTDDGLTPEGGKAIGIIVEKLVEELGVVNGYLNGTEEE